MSSKCENIELDMNRYIAGDFDRIKDYDALYEHLKECADCQKQFREARELIVILRAGREQPGESHKKIEALLKQLEQTPIAQENERMDVTPSIKDGNDHLKRQGYPSAIKCFDEALFLDPNNIEALINKGIALRKSGKIAEALPLLDEALKIDPNNIKAIFHKGLALEKSGKITLSSVMYRMVLKPEPKKPEDFILKGIVFGKLEKWEKSLSEYNNALTFNIQDEDKKEALINRGITLRKLERYKEALPALEEGLKIQPNCKDGWYNYGVALRKLRKNNEALYAFDKALEIKPVDHDIDAKEINVKALGNRGIALANSGNLDEALAALKEALTLDPQNAQTLTFIAIISSAQGDDEIARNFLDKAISIAPSDPDARYYRGYVARKLDEKQEIAEDRSAASRKDVLKEIWLLTDEETRRVSNLINRLRVQIQKATGITEEEPVVKKKK